MKQWFAQHRLAFTLVAGRARRMPLSLLLMIAVIGVTLSLPAMLYVGLDNLQRFAGNFVGSTPQISLFLKLDAPEAQVKDIGERLGKHADVASYRFVSRDNAWQEMQRSTGLADIGGGLEQNPLPDAYIVEAKSSDPVALQALHGEMQQWPGVERAQLDAVWVERLHTLLQLGNKLVMVIAGLLGLALLIITGNSIRLQIATQREEIELSRLIGATDRFIRRPFLYAGMLYGIGGGMAAWLIVAAAVWLFNASIVDLAQSYASNFRLLLPGTDIALALLGGSALLGWIGAYVAVNRALSEFDRY